MKQTATFYVTFWAQATQPGNWPVTWNVNHDGPLDKVIAAAESTIKNGTFPTASRFTIRDYKTDKQVYPDT